MSKASAFAHSKYVEKSLTNNEIQLEFVIKMNFEEVFPANPVDGRQHKCLLHAKLPFQQTIK